MCPFQMAALLKTWAEHWLDIYGAECWTRKRRMRCWWIKLKWECCGGYKALAWESTKEMKSQGNSNSPADSNTPDAEATTLVWTCQMERTAISPEAPGRRCEWPKYIWIPSREISRRIDWRTSTFSTTRTGDWQFPGRPTDAEEPSRWERKPFKTYFGDAARRERGMENDAILGGMSGRIRRGRPRTRWLDLDIL